MAITLTSVDPVKLDARGGAKLTILGDFSEHIGQEFYAELVPTVGDPIRCLSGRPGSAVTLYPLNTEKMVCFAPQTVAGTAYDLRVKRTDDSAVDTIAAPFTVLPKQYSTSLFGYRSQFPPTYKTGPRNLGLLERI